MIKALLLDLGGTLIDSSEQVFPGVQDALTVLEAFETEDHQPLVTCLVSDFTMPEPRTTEAIAAAFADYLKILDKTGLRSFFEPVDERVTLSTHVGVRNPPLRYSRPHSSAPRSLAPSPRRSSLRRAPTISPPAEDLA